jgi:hypothetical protein
MAVSSVLREKLAIFFPFVVFAERSGLITSFTVPLSILTVNETNRLVESEPA